MALPKFPVRSIPYTLPRIVQFAGLNLSTTSTQIEENESPDMQNMILDAQSQPDKRFGFARIYANSLGTGKINGLYEYTKINGTVTFLIHWGTNLYTQSGSAQPVSIFAGMANSSSKFFTFNDFCYILDGTNYLRYDGTTVVDVSTVAYVPTLTISTPPAGGGTTFENFNLLTPAFKQSFSGNNTATTFQLSLTGLDASPLMSAVVNGTTITEGATMTVNRGTGIVTFTTAPSTGTNNVIITGYKTQSGYANRIKQCKDFCLFGGSNDTRVFLYLNPSFPNYLFRSGLYDPTYFGDLSFQKIGSDANKIQKMIVQYDTAVILKSFQPNDTMVWNLQYQIDTTGNVSFPVKQLNCQIGCQSGDSVQLIDNMPTHLSQKGVYQLTGTNVRDERNMNHISDKIDNAADQALTGLLSEPNLNQAISIDYEKKYILTLPNGNSYVFDYRLGVWLKWTGINASVYCIRSGQSLYFGSNSDGIVYRMKEQNETNAYSDDGTAINCYWKSKVFSFDDDEHLKTVTKVWFSIKPSQSASADFQYASDRYLSPILLSSNLSLFNYATWDYSRFSYLLSSFPLEQEVKTKAKKVTYFQVILSNPRNNESMGILSVTMKVQGIRENK